jgi:DHA1 family arabinose polymer transporter-like MFS transporter
MSKSSPHLIALACGSFAIGMTEFTMMGILPNIAADLQIDIPRAGYLIALYALGVVVGAPTLTMLSAHYAPKKVLTFLMGLFVLFNGLFALAPSVELAMLTRFMAGLPHGAFFGLGAVVATQLAPPGRSAQSIAIMFTGMTVANLLGVPLGTYLGQAVSWHVTYGFITVTGLITMLAIQRYIPALPTPPKGTVKQQLHYFKTKDAWMMVAIISIGTGGMFAWMSYIAPLVTENGGLPSSHVPIIMVLAGLGMLVGNLLGGKLADRVRPDRAVIISWSVMIACLLLIFFTSTLSWMAYLMSFLTGVASFSISAPIQMMLIRSASGAETLAAAAGQASFNTGNTLGAYLGGLPIALGLGYHIPSLVGVGLALVGILLVLGYQKMLKNQLDNSK